MVARAASPDSFTVWIDLARRACVRELAKAARAARRAGSSWPPGHEPAPAEAPAVPGSMDGTAAAGGDPASRGCLADAGGQDGSGLDDDPEQRRLIRLIVPQAVAAAFEEALDLFRALVGSQATVESFVDALVGEAVSGPNPPDLEAVPLRKGPSLVQVESALAHATDRGTHLPAAGQASWARALAGVDLLRFEDLADRAGTGGPADLDLQIRELIRLEDRLERRIGSLLADMIDMKAWARLGFTGSAHYAEQRLGMSRASARARIRAARGLPRLPLVRQAYEEGSLTLSASLLVLRIHADAHPDRATQEAWIARAREATHKRLLDEARALTRISAELPEPPTEQPAPGREVSGLADAPPDRPAPGDGASVPGGAGAVSSSAPVGCAGPTTESAPAPAASPGAYTRRAARPLDDPAWHASLRREPGTARRRLAHFGRLASSLRSPDVFLRFRLPDGLAAAFLSAIESARAGLSRRADSVPWDQPWPDPDPPSSLLAAREFSIRCRRSPAWVGLLALLEDFVATWDEPRAASRGSRDAIFIRDGWRCSAPGCTARCHLEDHHVEYRSHGGGDSHANRTGLCRFHHLRGEHGGLARCRGVAPLGIVWRLGREEVGVWYLNEHRVAAPAAA